MNTLNATTMAALTSLGFKLAGQESNNAGLALERAYSQVLGWRMNGGTNDGGKDLIDPVTKQGVQVKSSFVCAQRFLRKITKKKNWIPICIGQPGTRAEIVDSLVKYGAWIDRRILAEKPYLLVAIARRRARVCGWKQEMLENNNKQQTNENADSNAGVGGSAGPWTR